MCRPTLSRADLLRAVLNDNPTLLTSEAEWYAARLGEHLRDPRHPATREEGPVPGFSLDRVRVHPDTDPV